MTAIAVGPRETDLVALAEAIGLELEPFQRRIIRAVNAAPRETLILIPRGNGKTTLMALVALHHLLTTEDARIYAVAASVPQARILFEAAADFARQARDALLGQPTRHDGGLVFVSKRGVRLAQSTLSGYWGKVLARAALDFDFYLATKHYCVHYMHATLGLPPRVIAEQMGWTLTGVLQLLAVYGHGDIGALEEIDRAFRANVTPLHAVNSDATGMQETA
jgi:hypothetical protein